MINNNSLRMIFEETIKKNISKDEKMLSIDSQYSDWWLK